ncbi:hypothetical protein ACF1CG_21555 [Streptomyces sp. NPDC014773]|uniref:hypothetical protein n=1 Tax=Streptomyces sp. NPDC014773 TaxID=3364908 RepID=UPI0036FA9595
MNRSRLSDPPRKHCWTTAERIEATTPDGPRHLPGRAERDADPVRDGPHGYVPDTHRSI